MPIEVEAAGQVDEFIRVLRRRVWWIVVPLCVIGSLGTFYAVVVPKKYVSECSVMIKDLGANAGEFGRNTAETEGLVAKEELESRARIKTVLTKLGWGEFKVLNEDGQTEYVKETILPSLSVNVKSSGRNAARRTVDVSFAHTDQEKAKDFLSGLTENWTEKVLNRERGEKEELLEDVTKRIAEKDVKLDDISTQILDLTST